MLDISGCSGNAVTPHYIGTFQDLVLSWRSHKSDTTCKPWFMSETKYNTQSLYLSCSNENCNGDSYSHQWDYQNLLEKYWRQTLAGLLLPFWACDRCRQGSICIWYYSLNNYINIFYLICTYLYLFHRTTSPICTRNKINVFLVRRKVFTWGISNYRKIKKRLIIFLAPLLEVISNVEYKKWEELKMREKIELPKMDK